MAADGLARRDRRWLLPALAGCALILFAVSLATGPATIPPGKALAALFIQSEGPETIILREIRLPRALLAAMVGASLGLSGAAMQGYLRNPLAEPGLIGVSAAAALGAVLAIQTGLAASVALGLPVAALAGAGLAVLPCYLGESAKELRRLTDPLEGESVDLWLHVSQDTQHLARVRIVMEFLVDRLRALESSIEISGSL